MVHIGNDWDELLKDTFASENYQQLRRFLLQEYRTHRVYPDMYDLFNALRYTSYADTRAVILGQDPYHQPGQAHGLCFSVRPGVVPPPSLVNIFKELRDDLGIDNLGKGGTLIPWAKSGVLLLNTVLTVERGKANSHAKWGWQRFTDAVIRATNGLPQPIVFVLWGAQAQKKAALLQTQAPRLILNAPHPSPLSSYRGFFGSRPFSKINEFLTAHGEEAIDWSL